MMRWDETGYGMRGRGEDEPTKQDPGVRLDITATAAATTSTTASTTVPTACNGLRAPQLVDSTSHSQQNAPSPLYALSSSPAPLSVSHTVPTIFARLKAGMQRMNAHVFHMRPLEPDT